jgi:hypothetical protein
MRLRNSDAPPLATNAGNGRAFGPGPGAPIAAVFRNTDEFGTDESVSNQSGRASANQTGRVSLTIVVPIVVPIIVPIVVPIIVPIVVPVIVTVIVTIVVPSVVVMIVLSIVPAAIVVRLVFRGSYEVHWPVARIILSAMLAPIPRMAGRHV